MKRKPKEKLFSVNCYLVEFYIIIRCWVTYLMSQNLNMTEIMRQPLLGTIIHGNKELHVNSVSNEPVWQQSSPG